MRLENYNTYFFILALIAISTLAFFLFKPFLMAILMAMVLAVVFRKPYKFFLKIVRGKKPAASALTCFLVLLVIILPVSMVLGLMANEAGDIYKKVSAEENFYQKRVTVGIDYVKNFPFMQDMGIEKMLSQEELAKSFKDASHGFLIFIQKAYQNIAGFVIWVFVMFFTLYYLLMEGKKIAKKIAFASPLRDAHEKVLLGKFISMARATLKGTIIIGIIQGTIGGLLFAFTGVPSPAIWGVIMIILSIIPAIGSGLVWFPAGVIMLFTGNIWQGVTILAVGLGVISVIDNFLRPKLVGRDTQMHPLLVFFATLGGIITFGLIGFIIGPIIMALFLALWEIYATEFKKQLKSYNA